MFSGVVTAFVIELSQKLEPDHPEIMTYLLQEQILLLRANGNASEIANVPSSERRPGEPTHTQLDVVINGLFFASLALSLGTALLSVLVKQWLHVSNLPWLIHVL